MAFHNRADAARQLAAHLARYHDSGAVVVAVPRGGVPVARIVADQLEAALDVVLVCKITAPGNTGCAVGPWTSRGG